MRSGNLDSDFVPKGKKWSSRIDIIKKIIKLLITFGVHDTIFTTQITSDGGIICLECRDSETGGLKYCGQDGVEEVETDCGQDASRDETWGTEY